MVMKVTDMKENDFFLKYVVNKLAVLHTVCHGL